MLSVLIEGPLIGGPVRRTSAKGTTFVTAQVRCNADDSESVLCSVIAFQAAAAESLAALGAGDTAAVARPTALLQWDKKGEHKIGLKVTASRVISVYEAGMQRKAASPEREPGGSWAPVSSAVPERHRPATRPAAAAPPSNLAD